MKKLAKRILIVDDEEFIRQSFADYFEDNMWLTLQASSGEQALSLLEKETVDAAIVDIRMGGMDGNTFIREAIKTKTNMVFVICTGSPEFNVPEDLQKETCVSNHLFIKPINDLDDLLNTILKMLGSNLSE